MAGEGRLKSFVISYPFLVACTARLPLTPADSTGRSHTFLPGPETSTDS